MQNCSFPPYQNMTKNLPRPSHAPLSSLEAMRTPRGTLAVHKSLHLSITSHLALSSLIALPYFYVLWGYSGAGTGGAFTAATKAKKYSWSASGCTTIGVWMQSCQTAYYKNFINLHCWKVSADLAPKQLAHHQETMMGLSEHTCI